MLVAAVGGPSMRGPPPTPGLRQPDIRASVGDIYVTYLGCHQYAENELTVLESFEKREADLALWRRDRTLR